MNETEAKRQRRLTDQMLTTYSRLRDRYACMAMCLTLGIMASAVILCTFTFVPEDAFAYFGVRVSPTTTTVVLGIASSIVLFLSIAELKVNWKERSQQYAEAAERLADLKAAYRRMDTQQGLPQEMQARLGRQYVRTMKGLPRIPESKFLKYKAYHLKKVQLSKMIDEAVGCPVWWLRLRLLAGSLLRRGKPNRESADEPPRVPR